MQTVFCHSTVGNTPPGLRRPPASLQPRQPACCLQGWPADAPVMLAPGDGQQALRGEPGERWGACIAEPLPARTPWAVEQECTVLRKSAKIAQSDWQAIPCRLQRIAAQSSA